MADQAGWHPDQLVSQGGDHGLAVADAVTKELPAGSGGGGELVQPAGDADREQRNVPLTTRGAGILDGRRCELRETQQ